MYIHIYVYIYIYIFVYLFIHWYAISINVDVIFIWVGIPETHLRRFRLAAGFFLCENNLPFWPNFVCCHIWCFHWFFKTPNRREAQIHAEKWSKYFLNSHLDPIGDQSDVQHLSIYCMYLAYLANKYDKVYFD